MAPPPPPAATQPLPSKEAALFRQLVRLYETKQYKKAVKAADAILKKFPQHGETLCMKGLTLSYMDKRDEAYELVRLGLRCDLKSHVCWHVYGLLHRADNNYLEAIKSYMNALRLDNDNQQILRDLAMLQIQMRDLGGFVQTRHKLLKLRPNNRNNWVAFAVAHHLDGNHDMAATILSSYESTVGDVPAGEAYEHSELLQYKAAVLAEGGKPADALALLDKEAPRLRDPLGAAHTRVALLLQLGRAGEAEALCRTLLGSNPDDYRVHEALVGGCMGLAAPTSADGQPPWWQPQQSGQQQQPGQQQQQQQQQPGQQKQQQQAANGCAADGTGAASSSSSSSSSGGGGGSSAAGLWSPHSGKKRRPLRAYSDADRARLAALYDGLARQHPGSLACRRIPLDFLDGDAFAAAADGYVRRFLLRGVPSLFGDLKPLYADAAKAEALGALFTRYRDELLAGRGLPPPLRPEAVLPGGHASSSSSGSGSSSSAGNGTGTGNGTGNGPQALAVNGEGGGGGGDDDGGPLLWVWHYLAQHYDRLGDVEAALAASDAALALAPPSVIEPLLARARILKHAGDAAGAALAADAARQRDLADRYANSVAVKALLAAGQVEAAEATAMLFTRDGDQINNLYDMQHMWYEVRAGDAHLVRGDLGRALKQYAAVGRHFGDFAEDQFDFHSYCVRKLTLRAYVALLRMEDRLRHHPFYLRAALGAVDAYLRLHDAPAAAAAAGEAAEAALAAMSPEERKREKLRRKKEEKRREQQQQQQEQERQQQQQQQRVSSSGGGGGGADGAAAAGGDKKAASGGGGGSNKQRKAAAARAPDPDPDGAKLAATTDPLGEATRYVAALRQAAPQHLETQLAAARVYGRKGRALLEAAAVRRARDLAGEGHPDVHRAVVALARRVAAAPPGNAAVRAVVAGDVLPDLLGGAADVAAYATAWAARHAAGSGSGSSLRARAAAAETRALLDPASKAAAVKQLLEAAPPAASDAAGAAAGAAGGGGADLPACVEVDQLLQREPLADAAAAAEWRQRCAAAFPRAACFGGAKATPPERLVEQLADRLGGVSLLGGSSGSKQ